MAWKLSLEGQCGIVTGAASGIGRAAARHIAAMGADLLLVDLDAGRLEEAAFEIRQAAPERRVAAAFADASHEAEVRRAVAEALSAFGAIDFLVNGHGILRRTAFADIATEEWDLMMAVNLRGCFLFCREVIPHLLRRGRGAIVNVASLAGRTGSILGGAHYTAAKHGLVGLSRHLAREYARQGIRVNAFCPGATLTPMTLTTTTPAELERVAAAIPRGRWASPEEQAGVIGFLLSEAAANITGACIDSNGGSLMI